MTESAEKTFITEIELITTPKDRKVLNTRFEVARLVYNAVLGEGFRRLNLMHESKEYRAAKKIKNGKERTEAFKEVYQRFGLHGKYCLESWANANYGARTGSWVSGHLDSHVLQKLAIRAGSAIRLYSFHKIGKPRFKSHKRGLHSVEAKTSLSCIRWKGDVVEWKGLILPIRVDKVDEVIQHGLDSKVKYVRIVRRNIRGKQRFFAQFIHEGEAYHKQKHMIGDKAVGLDMGPSTIAVVSQEKSHLLRFCDEIVDYQKEIRVLQRKTDRQRRSNNPMNYNETGTCKKGAHKWIKSKRQKQTEAQIAEIKRKEAAYRKSLHGKLVNQILAIGCDIQTENISFKSFQKMWGKSIGHRAPGMFLEMLSRKAENAGGEVFRFSTRTTRLSQVCHNCGVIEKKPLSVRWHDCDCGIFAQRDLYSAFLAIFVEQDEDGRDFLNAGRARTAWPEYESALQAALSNIQTANGGLLPSSFGISQRQSGLLAKSGISASEREDDVTFQNIGVRELSGAYSETGTPRL